MGWRTEAEAERYTGTAVETRHSISEKTSHSNEVYEYKVVWL